MYARLILRSVCEFEFQNFGCGGNNLLKKLAISSTNFGPFIGF